MYRPPSVRNFKLFIGELTAEAAAVHVSLLEAQKCEYVDKNYWVQKAEEAGIKLEGVASRKIINSQTKFSLVSIYSGFDLFLEELELECKRFGFNWKNLDKVSPIEVFEKNFTKAHENKTYFRYETDAVNYFRILRNSVVHPSDENKQKAIDFYTSKRVSIEFIRNKYRMITAPNDPDSISFHDIKFWCQFLLDYTEIIAGLLEPTESMIYATVPFGNWRKYGKNHKKLKKVAQNYLHSQYGYDLDKSTEIIEKNYDPLA